LIEERVSRLRKGEGARFLLRALALITGLAGMAFPAPVIRKVFEDERELRALHIDLPNELHDGLAALLLGMEKRP
jgi:hypothetical protein